MPTFHQSLDSWNGSVPGTSNKLDEWVTEWLSTQFFSEEVRVTTLDDEQYDVHYKAGGCPIGKNMSDHT